jgi:hypothetical protein
VADRSVDASCLLGLAGLAVERVVLTRLGVKIVQLVTDDPEAARCPCCRTRSTSGKDWVLTRPHDLPCGGEVRGRAVAQAALAVSCRGLSTTDVHRAGRAGAGGDADDDAAAGVARGGGRGRP